MSSTSRWTGGSRGGGGRGDTSGTGNGVRRRSSPSEAPSSASRATAPTGASRCTRPSARAATERGVASTPSVVCRLPSPGTAWRRWGGPRGS
eukprot:9445949-Alexandrium_andersonii.AAC.1